MKIFGENPWLWLAGIAVFGNIVLVVTSRMDTQTTDSPRAKAGIVSPCNPPDCETSDRPVQIEMAHGPDPLPNTLAFSNDHPQDVTFVFTDPDGVLNCALDEKGNIRFVFTPTKGNSEPTADHVLTVLDACAKLLWPKQSIFETSITPKIIGQ